MPFPINFSFDALMGLIFDNIFIIVALGLAGYFILNYLKFGFKSKIKPVNRSEVERIKFIERMKMNKDTTPYKWLIRGNKIIGKIEAFSGMELMTSNPSKMPIPVSATKYVKSKPSKELIPIYQMVIKPILIPKLRICNPLAKQVCLQIQAENVEAIPASKEMIIPQHTYFDYYFGIYYDKEGETIHVPTIKDQNLFRSDNNMLASIYYAKSQEQSTFDPEKAHELAMKEKELQIEMSKKRGKITSI